MCRKGLRAARMVTEHTLALVGVWKPTGVKAAALRLKPPADGRKSEASAPVQNHHHPRHAGPKQEETSETSRRVRNDALHMSAGKRHRAPSAQRAVLKPKSHFNTRSHLSRRRRSCSRCRLHGFLRASDLQTARFPE